MVKRKKKVAAVALALDSYDGDLDSELSSEMDNCAAIRAV
jgi:hypothetical protein